MHLFTHPLAGATLALSLSCLTSLAACAAGDDVDAQAGNIEDAGDAATLCLQTGGAWEEGSCACEQDGASIGYEFDAQEGCGWPSAEPIAATLAGEGAPLDSYVDPERGVYVITRPGAIDALGHAPSLEGIESYNGWIQQGLADTSCKLEDTMPPLGCEAEELEIAPSGCFHEPVRDYARMSTLMSFLEDYEMGSWSDAEKDAVALAESQMRARVALADAGITLYFGRADGEWVLLLVDAAEQDCSA
jgi:hypothetical protein